MIVLDTNVVSELMKPAPEQAVRTWLSGLNDETFATTAVTLFEIEYGIARLSVGRRRSELHARFEALANAFTVLPLDQTAAALGGQLRAMRDAAGLPSTASDMMIAGIVLSEGAILATRNMRDFDKLPIQVIDPWQAAG